MDGTDMIDGAGRRSWRDERAVASPTPTQPMLPLDEPVPFTLTARGRRAVADAALPALHIVRGGGARAVDLDDTTHTGRVRARALHRAGVDPHDIADELGVEPLHVQGWVADLPPSPAGLRVVEGAGRFGGVARRRGVPRAAESAARDSSGAGAAPDVSWDDEVDTGMGEASRRLPAEPALRGGLGIVVGLVREDPHALLLGADQLGLLGAGVAWMADALGADVAAARLLVVHHPQDHGDRLAHAAARHLDLPLSAVATTRDASRVPGAPQLRWRLADPALAARVAGWRRHLLAELSGSPSARTGVWGPECAHGWPAAVVAPPPAAGT